MAPKKQPQDDKIKAKIIRGTNYIIDFRGEPLGKGFFGQVRRVYDTQNKQKKLCCKIISMNSIDNIQSAKNELNMIDQLPNHQNLVSYDKIKFNTNSEQYFIMEFCNGGNLQQYINKNDYLSESEICDFLYQFIEGYKELNKLKMLHCDLKPENILIHNRYYKITDLGLAKLIEFQNQEVDPRGNIPLQLSYFFS